MEPKVEIIEEQETPLPTSQVEEKKGWVPPTIGFTDYRMQQLRHITPSNIGDLISIRERVARGEIRQERNWMGLMLGIGILIFIIFIALQMLPGLLQSMQGVLPTRGGDTVQAAILTGVKGW